MKSMQRNIIVIVGAVMLKSAALGQVLFYDRDSIPEVFWTNSSFNLLDNDINEMKYDSQILFSYTFNNFLVENLSDYDSINVIEPEGMFIRKHDSSSIAWEPEFPLTANHIRQQMDEESDSLVFKTWSSSRIKVNSIAKLIDSLPHQFIINYGKNGRVNYISSSKRSVTYKYSVTGKLKEIRFNHPENPDSCPDAQGDEDCCCCCEGETRKITLHYKKGRLEYCTRYIYYAGDQQHYLYFLKYY